MELINTETDGPLTLSGRVLAARQILALCQGDEEQPSEALAPYETSEPARGDLKLSSKLDAKGRLAFQNDRSASLVSGTLCASVYDGVCWRKFDLRSITARAAYPNPAVLESAVAAVRAAAESAAGLECTVVNTDDQGQPFEEPLVIVVCTGHRH